MINIIYWVTMFVLSVIAIYTKAYSACGFLAMIMFVVEIVKDKVCESNTL